MYLTKIGNFKLGAQRAGKVIAFEKILVTGASKNGKENFSPFNGFSAEGEDEVYISLPFNSPELNFEVNYVSFIKVDNVEYIIKAGKINDDIIGYPLNAEDFDKPPVDFGKLNQESIERFSMEKTGLLKAMIPSVSSFGEVFYLKTKSIHTINAIQNQLAITNALLGGLANYPLTLKALRKDVSNGNTITYLSVGLDMERLREYKESDEYLDDTLDYQLFEDLYVQSLSDVTVVKASNSKITVLKDDFTETVSIFSQKEEFLELIKNSGVDDAHVDVILKNANSKTIVTILKYYVYLKENNRKYSSVFLKSIKNKMKPFEMIREMSNKQKKEVE